MISVTSQAYDRGGKGYLDDDEKEARARDIEGKGYLSPEQRQLSLLARTAG
jgi:hypothetical protein